MHGLATPQFLGGPPPHIVPHASFDTGGAAPASGWQLQSHPSRNTEQSASLAQGPAGGGRRGAGGDGALALEGGAGSASFFEQDADARTTSSAQALTDSGMDIPRCYIVSRARGSDVAGGAG